MSLIGLGGLIFGAGGGWLISKKINDANYTILVEQAKAKTKAIEFEAERVIKDDRVKVSDAYA